MRLILIVLCLLSGLAFGTLRADLNHDGRVDLADLAIFAKEWLLSEAEVSKMALGDELVVNGGFDADTDWTKGSGWSISGGKASFVYVDSITAITQTISSLQSKVYHVSFDYVTADVGGICAVSTEMIPIPNGTGTYSGVIPTIDSATSKDVAFLNINSTSMSIDNVSVREYTPNPGGLSGAEYLSILDEER